MVSRQFQQSTNYPTEVFSDMDLRYLDIFDELVETQFKKIKSITHECVAYLAGWSDVLILIDKEPKGTERNISISFFQVPCSFVIMQTSE